MDQNQVQTMVKEKLGFVPNLLQTMSVAPPAVRVYVDGFGTLAEGVLTEAEQQMVQLATSVYNECAYCSSAHSVLSESAGTSRPDVQAVRAGGLPADERLAAIARTTRRVLEKRGHLDADDLKAVEADGVSRAQLYEIVAAACLKTLTNWTAHFENPEIDEAFRYDG